MEEIKITFKTLTPLWTGGVEGKCDRLYETGIIGSLRWWYEAVVRGRGYKACEPTSDNKCQFELKKPEDVLKIYEKICPVCYLFGTTGWKSRFSGRVLKNNLAIPYAGKVVVEIGKGRGWHYESGLMGNIELAFDCKEEILIKDGKEIKLTEFFPSILKILLYLISEHGMLGAKTSMGYGVVKCQINDSELSVDDNDWKNFTDFLSLFNRKFKENISELPDLKDMFFVKFKVDNNFNHILHRIKSFYRFQDGIVEGDINKWKNSGWLISSPIVRKEIRKNIKSDFSSDTNLRHFLMGIGGKNSNFSAIQVSHVYKRNNELEFRIYGWLPDIEPIKDKRNDIIELLSNIFQNPPWNNQIPSQIQNNICWNGSLSLVDNSVKNLFIKGESK